MNYDLRDNFDPKKKFVMPCEGMNYGRTDDFLQIIQCYLIK